MEWKKEKPKTPGWYWFKDDLMTCLLMVNEFDCEGEKVLKATFTSELLEQYTQILSLWDGEWQGPIKPEID